MVKRYDAGLLNDYGGGNVEWWQDYIRAEVERCNDHYEADYAALAEENRRLRDASHKLAMYVLQSELYSKGKPDYVEAVDNVLAITQIARREAGRDE